MTLNSPNNFVQYTSHELQKVLAGVKTIALVGASQKPERDSHKVMADLLKRGYQVFPVNPNAAGETILEQYCYATLADIPHSVDMVDIFRASEAALAITQEAIEINAKVVWMQLDVINSEAYELATAAGLTVVMDRCPKIVLNNS